MEKEDILLIPFPFTDLKGNKSDNPTIRQLHIF